MSDLEGVLEGLRIRKEWILYPQPNKFGTNYLLARDVLKKKVTIWISEARLLLLLTSYLSYHFSLSTVNYMTSSLANKQLCC